MPKYRHLFFDLDNTVYDFETNSYLAMKNAFDKIGLLSKLSSFDNYFKTYIKVNDALWTEYREKKITKDYLRGKRHQDALAEFQIEPHMEFTDIDDTYLEMMTHQTELFPNTLEVLSALRKKGYNLHIITNGFKEVQHKKLKKTKKSDYENDVYKSE
jgi:putative hydrolase of the HAD superfamily